MEPDEPRPTDGRRTEKRMSDAYIKNVIEAALLAAARPVPVSELLQIFDEQSRPTPKEMRAVLEQLAADYEGRGVTIRETANGFRFQVRSEFAQEVSRLWPDRPRKYSRALLETLALIAYRQPITRAEIENVRGVAVNPEIVKTLMERNWVRVVGHRDVPGHPELLGTTTEFLDYFSLKSIEDLPPLAELKSLTDLNLQLPLPGTWTAQPAPRRGARRRRGWSHGPGEVAVVPSARRQRRQARCRGGRRCRRRRVLRAGQFGLGTRGGAAVRRSEDQTAMPRPRSTPRRRRRAAAEISRAARPRLAPRHRRMDSRAAPHRQWPHRRARPEGHRGRRHPPRRPAHHGTRRRRRAGFHLQPLARRSAARSRRPNAPRSSSACRRARAGASSRVSPMPGIDGGLELVTSDGALAAKLQRAVHQLPSEFSVRVKGLLGPDQLAGVESRQARPSARMADRKRSSTSEAELEGSNRWYSIVARGASGKDIRQLFERQGALVSRVPARVAGHVGARQGLARGQFRQLERTTGTEHRVRSLTRRSRVDLRLECAAP